MSTSDENTRARRDTLNGWFVKAEDYITDTVLVVTQAKDEASIQFIARDNVEDVTTTITVTRDAAEALVLAVIEQLIKAKS